MCDIICDEKQRNQYIPEVTAFETMDFIEDVSSGEVMEQGNDPSAEIRYDGNLFAIENFRVSREEVGKGNPYNTTFHIRVISGAFSGYAFCEYDSRSAPVWCKARIHII